MTWMKTVQNDLDSHGLSWSEAVDLAQNRPLWRLLATMQWRYALVVVQAGDDDDDLLLLFSHGYLLLCVLLLQCCFHNLTFEHATRYEATARVATNSLWCPYGAQNVQYAQIHLDTNLNLFRHRRRDSYPRTSRAVPGTQCSPEIAIMCAENEACRANNATTSVGRAGLRASRDWDRSCP